MIEMGYCRKCRNNIEKEDKFCQICGLQITDLSSWGSSNPRRQILNLSYEQIQSQNKRNYSFSILVVITFVIFILIAIMSSATMNPGGLIR